MAWQFHHELREVLFDAAGLITMATCWGAYMIYPRVEGEMDNNEELTRVPQYYCSTFNIVKTVDGSGYKLRCARK